MLAHAEDRHDVGMVQACRGASLAAKALEAGGITELMVGQRLERDMPAERFLNRLVDHAHSAGADPTKQHVVAQARRHCGSRDCAGRDGTARLAGARAQGLHHDQRGEERLNSISQLGMGSGVFGNRGPLTAAAAIKKSFHELINRVETGTRFIHGLTPSRPPGNWPRMCLSRSRARR